MTSMENIVEEAFNTAIVEELLREIEPSVTEEKIQEIWKLCRGNPWNATLLYQILKLKTSYDH